MLQAGPSQLLEYGTAGSAPPITSGILKPVNRTLNFTDSSGKLRLQKMVPITESSESI